MYNRYIKKKEKFQMEIQKKDYQPSMNSFSLLLKVKREGASLTSELNWFQILGPRNEIDFCPFAVLKRGTRKSASVFLSLIPLC